MTAPPRALPRARSRSTRAQRISAIDIGSNSIRQIIADVSADGAIRVLDELKAAPRLGAGIVKKGVMGEASMVEAIESLRRMVTLAQQFKARRIEVVATSAVRVASNAAEFLERVRRATGIKPRVLAGEEEAMLAFRSALAHFDLGSGRAVVMDIGGGSLELALSADGLLERLSSLPYGAIRMTEQYIGQNPSARKVERLRKSIRADLRRALPLRDWRGATIIGSGGTFTNLAGIYLARRGMHVRSVQGTRVPRAELVHIIEWLSELTPEERGAVPGLNPARADIIIAGLGVAAEVLSRLEAREVIVSAFGIREGLLLDAARIMPSVSDPGEARAKSVRSFADRCHFEAPHATQVQRLSLEIHDAIGKRLGAVQGDRELLADAALLHDVGYHIGYDKHHKHSFHLISHAELLGMSPEEKAAVAHIARYHRGSTPSRKHESFIALDRALRDRIVRLAAILRVADGLDRGHVGAVDHVRVRFGPRALRIIAFPKRGAGGMRLELWGASRKAGMLEDVAGMPVEISGPDGVVVREGATEAAAVG